MSVPGVIGDLSDDTQDFPHPLAYRYPTEDAEVVVQDAAWRLTARAMPGRLRSRGGEQAGLDQQTPAGEGADRMAVSVEDYEPLSNLWNDPAARRPASSTRTAATGFKAAAVRLVGLEAIVASLIVLSSFCLAHARGVGFLPQTRAVAERLSIDLRALEQRRGLPPQGAQGARVAFDLLVPREALGAHPVRAHVGGQELVAALLDRAARGADELPDVPELGRERLLGLALEEDGDDIRRVAHLAEVLDLPAAPRREGRAPGAHDDEERAVLQGVLDGLAQLPRGQFVAVAEDEEVSALGDRRHRLRDDEGFDEALNVLSDRSPATSWNSSRSPRPSSTDCPARCAPPRTSPFPAPRSRQARRPPSALSS